MAESRRTGAAPRPGNGDGEEAVGSHDGSVASIMASLSGAGGGSSRSLQYVTKTVETDRPMYVGLGENHMEFKKWYKTRFTPRVWDPVYQSGIRKRESKLLQQRITAVTALQRRRKPDDDGPRPPLEIDPATMQMMEQLADTELPTVDDRFELLVKYVHETAGMKESILEDITDQGLTGQAKLDYFIDKMEASTSPVALQKAMWMGIQRQGLMEQPAAYATRFRKAADHCGRSKADINEKFMTTLLAPWDTEPALKGFKAQVEGKHVVQIQDDEALHMVAMAETAFSFEKMVIQRTVIQIMERDGGLTPATPKDQTAKGKAKARDGTAEGGGSQDMAAQLDLPFKKIRGRSYRACAKCYVVQDKTAWHPPSKCPVEKREQPSAGTALQGKALYGQKQEFICFNCDQPGHSYKQCNQPIRSEKLKAAQQAWLDRKTQRDKGKGQNPYVPRAGTAMMAAAEQSVSDQQDGSQDTAQVMMATLVKEMQQLTAALSPKKPDGEQKSSGRAFMAQVQPASWLPAAEAEDGFAFADSYSSDDNGMGLLGSHSASIRRRATPIGLVPAAMTVTTRGSRRVQPTPPAQPPVPASARRQARMRAEDHDETRALRNRLPPGMVNPRDVAARTSAEAALVDTGPDDHSDMVMRVAQLVSLLRTALAHTKFGALPTELVADHSQEGVEAWERAPAAALSGAQHDGQDPRSVAWHCAIQKAVSVWLAQAKLEWRDLIRIDLRAVFREAVLATFGSRAAQYLAAPTAYGLPPQPEGQLLFGADLCGMFARIPLPPPPKDSQSQEDRPEGLQSQSTAAQPVTDRPIKTLEEHREARAKWQKSVRWQTRRPVAMLDGATANITVNGQAVKQVVLDLGANEPMTHQRLIQTLKVDVNPNGRRIVGITGAPHMMPRTVDPLTVALFPDDSDKEALASDRMMVMQGDALPDLLLDCEMMAQLGIIVDPASWTATFQGRPYQELSKPVVLPLVRPTQAQLAALAEVQAGRTWPESS